VPSLLPELEHGGGELRRIHLREKPVSKLVKQKGSVFTLIDVPH
jgi:hypothetical protein